MKARIQIGGDLLPSQLQLLQSNAKNRSIWGGYGSGKTTGAAYAFVRHCIENPWSEEVFGRDRPFSFVLGPTHKALVESAARELRRIIPGPAIIKERTSPDWFWTLANGHEIRFRTSKSTIEGASATGLWCDEVQKIPDENIFGNFQARVRDPRARSLLVLTSGVPECGWMQDYFEKDEFKNDPDRLNLHVSTRDNYHLPPTVLRDIIAQVSAGNMSKFIDGHWQTPSGVVYHEFSATKYVPAPFSSGGHLWDWPGDRSLPVLLGVDIGRQSVVSIWQEVQRKCRRPVTGKPGQFETYSTTGLHMVDEVYVTDQPMEEVCRRVKARGWTFHSSTSKAYADPTTRGTEVAAIRRELGIPTVQAQRGQPNENLEWGYDHVNWAMRDADGNVRVTFYSGLPKGKHTLMDALPKYHFGKSGKAVRDDVLDHHVDAMRYPIVHVLKPSHRSGSR